MRSLHRTNFTKQERKEQLGPAYKGNLYRDANKGTMHPLSQTDLGHKKGYEERSVRHIAERAGFTQKEYDDMMKNSAKYTRDGETIYQSEYFKNNRSHKYEEHDALLSRHNGYIMVQNYRRAQQNGNTNVPRPGTEKQQTKEKEGVKMDTQQNEEARKRRIPPDSDKSRQGKTESAPKAKAQSTKSAGKASAQGKALGNCKGGNTPAGRAPAGRGQSAGGRGQSAGGNGGHVGGHTGGSGSGGHGGSGGGGGGHGGH